MVAAREIVRALDERLDDAWNIIFRPMIVRVQVGLDRVDVDLSTDRLVERLLQTSNHNSNLGEGEGDNLPLRTGDDSAPAESIVRLAAPAELKRTGKEMKFIVEGDTNGV